MNEGDCPVQPLHLGALQGKRMPLEQAPTSKVRYG